MSPVTISFTIFAIILGSSLVGMLLRRVLPEHHLRDESRDVVKLGIGLVGTMSALVLGLLVGSAKTSYDSQNSGLIQLSANIVFLDQILTHYGPEAQPEREMLRQAVTRILEQTSSTTLSRVEPKGFEGLYEEIDGLAPKNDLQRSLRSQALSVATNTGQMRWLLYEQGTTSVSMPLLVVMVFWLSIIFMVWGALAPANGTLLITLAVSALSVSGAIFLILEMYSPYRGLIRISDAPLRAALAHLGG